LDFKVRQSPAKRERGPKRAKKQKELFKVLDKPEIGGTPRHTKENLGIRLKKKTGRKQFGLATVPGARVKAKNYRDKRLRGVLPEIRGNK